MNETPSVALTLDFGTLSLVELLGNEGVLEFQKQFAQTPDKSIVRGLLHRAGRAGFYHWHEQRRGFLGWDDQGFSHAPVKKKISGGLMKICEVITAETGTAIPLLDQGNRWMIELAPQPGSVVLNGDYLAGFVQEFSSWAGLGKFYRVTVECDNKAEQKTCRIILFKEPLDD